MTPVRSWRAAACIAVGCSLGAAALAQTAPPPAPVSATPLAPLPGVPANLAPSLGARPAYVTPAVPASVAPPAAQAPSSGPAPPGSPAPTPALSPPIPDVWLPRGTAQIQALDKVNARSTVLSVPVGQTATFGSLTIAVKACVVRPPDQPQDSAAFLVITDSHTDLPGFSGWMVADDPSLSMLQHPIYDVRVAGCRA